MKLGIISSMASTPWGGSEELWVALAKEALGNGFKVSVSVYDWNVLPKKTQKIQELGAVIHLRSRISYDAFLGKIKGKLNQLFIAERELNSFVHAEKPDMIFINTGAFCDLEINPLRSFLIKLKIPFCIVVHSNTESYPVNVSKINEIREVCKKAKKVFFVSKRIQVLSEKQINHKFTNASPVINPLNIDKVEILPFPESATIRMACVGSLQIAVKGQALLLEVLSLQKWKERNWELNIFGYGPDENIIKDLIKTFQLENRVILRGFTNNIREQVWAQNSILLMPSYIEGMPISLLEAMLCGRTAVVTDVGGNTELIKENFSGFISHETTIESFDKALEKAWINRTEWKSMGIKAFEEASTFYGMDPVGDLLKTIEQLI